MLNVGTGELEFTTTFVSIEDMEDSLRDTVAVLVELMIAS